MSQNRRRLVAVWSSNVFLGITMCHLLLSSAAEASESNADGLSASGKTNSRSQLIFDGRSLQGWKQSGNWKIADEAFYCSRIAGGNNDLHYTRKVPGDCEILFEWKELGEVEWKTTGDIRAGKSNPGFAISYNAGERGTNDLNSSYGASIDYCVSGISIRLHSRDIDDRSTSANRFTSGFLTTGASKDSTKPIGQWNRSRIVSKGPRIQFWLNDNKGFDFDLRDKRFNIYGEQEHRRMLDLAVDEWLRLKKDGLYLSVIAPFSEGIANARVAIRLLAIRRSE